MTRRGAVVTAFFALLFFLGRLTGGSEIVYFMVCVGLLLMYSLISAALSALFLHFAFQPPIRAAVRGEQADIRLTCTGLRLLPAFVSVRVGLNSASIQEYGLQLSPGQRMQVVSLPLDCTHRGIWTLQMERLRVRDIFGLFAFPSRSLASRRSREELRLTVYPRLSLTDFPRFSLPVSPFYSEDRLTTAEAGDSSAGVRVYRDGDSLKRIHWKLTAKMQEPFTRQYETPVDQYALIIVDGQLPPAVREIEKRLDYIDALCECAGEIAWSYASHCCRVRLILPGANSGDMAIESVKEFDEVCGQLAAASFGDGAAVSPLRHLLQHVPSIHSLYYLTGKLEEEAMGCLQSIAARHCRTFCVLVDPHTAETTLTRRGEVQLLHTFNSRETAQVLGDES
ncbi:MAG: DUF58 domain-containing protein [Clostridiales bacterium]|nr:DUF58 domain-containing protein [Clostridiales bacterium]